jgi:hypothetical protein
MKVPLIFALILSSASAFPQTKIRGKITDQKDQPLPGVNIVIKDTYDGASSDANGNFDFSTEEKGERIIIASSVGYKTTQEAIRLEGQAIDLTIQLKEEINALEAVVISAGSFTAGDEKRRTILKAIDIATTAGATADIAGVLNTLPGTQKVGESGRLFVRGGDSNETRTFIDGVAVLNPYGTSAPNTPSRGRFLPFMFKGTSFSTGGYSAEYGQALSSALVLNSKDKADMNQTDLGFLSVGTDIAHTQVWDKASWTGKVQYTNITPYFHLINQRIDWVAPPVAMEGSTAYRQQIGKDGLFKFFGNFNQSDFSLYNHGIADPSSKQLYDLKNYYRYSNASYKQSINDKWSVRSGFSYNYNQNVFTIDRYPELETEAGTHSKIVFENSVSEKVELKVGGEVMSRSYSASKVDSITNLVLARSFTETISSSFVEAEAYASNHLVFRGGMRGEYNSLNKQFGLDPRFSVAYKPKEKGQFSFAYGKFRQSAKNMYLRENNLLGSERADHFILNYQIISNNRTFRVETYYKRYYDLVKFQYQGLDTIFQNTGTGYAKGVEVFWRDNQSIRNVDYWVSYSYLDTKRNYLNFPYSAIPAFASAHNFSVVYKHFITPLKSQIGLTYSYASPRRYFNPNTTDFNSNKTPSYQDLSANISYLPKYWLIIHLSCTNLLNHNNIFGYQYNATPGSDGVYASRPIRQAAQHFLFLGVFITLTKNKSVNQLPNL